MPPAKWVRRQGYKLARVTYTPITYWVNEVTILELLQWIREINEIAKEEKRGGD